MASNPIYLPPQKIDPTNPFDGDALRRRDLAERLTTVVTKMQQGGVIAIDGNWGDGKSWFGKNWFGMLKYEYGYKTAFIDAFEGDHVDDPFSLLAASILELVKEDATATADLKAKLFKVGRTVCAGLAKGVVNATVRYTIGEEAGKALSDSVTESIGDAAGDITEALVKSQIEGFVSSQESINQLRATLEKLPKPGGKPAVIFVDELDRCRPDFAVKTLERIKHFFDVQGVVFVLLINRKALVSAVRGLYGLGDEAERYLSKFIHFSVQLPKKVELSYNATDSMKQVCRSIMVRYGFDINKASSKQFIDSFCTKAAVLGMTFRDVERAVILFSFAKENGFGPAYIAWPILVKLYSPTLFEQALRGDGGKGVREILLVLRNKVKEVAFLDTMISLQDNANKTSSELIQQAQALLESHETPDAYLKRLFNAVDVNLDW